MLIVKMMYFMGFAHFAQMSHTKKQQMDFQPNDSMRRRKGHFNIIT